MKKRYVLGLALLLLSIVGTVLVYGNAESTPYVCSYCGEAFYTEGALVNHIKVSHDIDLQIQGELPECQTCPIEHKEYIPLAFYSSQTTEDCFYTEAALCQFLAK